MKRILTAMLVMMLVVFAAMSVSAAEQAMFDESIGSHLTSYDSSAAQQVGTAFQLRQTGDLTAVKYYVYEDFVAENGDEANEYVFDMTFTVNVWDASTGSNIYSEAFPTTVDNYNYWLTFTLATPLDLEAGKDYMVSVHKPVNGYNAFGQRNNQSFNDYINSAYFNFPAARIDGSTVLGAWNSDVNSMPTNSWNANGGAFWGVIPVAEFDPIPDTPVEDTTPLLGTPMYGNALAFGNGGYDAAHQIGTGFTVTEPSYITQVRYYFPNDFFVNHKLNSYTFNFQIKLWEKDSGVCISAETIPATITAPGWHTFTLSNPWPVGSDTVYCASVYKGINGYTTVKPTAETVVGEGFIIPSYIGAWNNDVNSIPTNSEVHGNNWGVDVVRSSRQFAEVEGLLGYPMIGSTLDDNLVNSGLSNDAGKNIAQFFVPKCNAQLVQVRYFFPNGFINKYGTDGAYTDDFVITVWERGYQALIASETINATITADGWYTFTLTTPVDVAANVVYCASVYKNVMAYTSQGGAFSDLYSPDYFSRPADGFGAWNNDVNAMPNNSYELAGGRWWGTDPVIVPVPVATIGDAEYFTFDAALEAAVEGDEIVLLGDTAINADTVIPAGVTVNTAEYGIVVSGIITLTNNGTLVGNVTIGLGADFVNNGDIENATVTYLTPNVNGAIDADGNDVETVVTKVGNGYVIDTEGVANDITPVLNYAKDFGFYVDCILGDTTIHFTAEQVAALDTSAGIIVGAYDNADYADTFDTLFNAGYKVKDIFVRNYNMDYFYTDSAIEISVEADVTDPTVYFVGEELVEVEGATAADGVVTFTAPHLSTYAVGEIEASADDVTIAFKGKLSAFMDTLYIRYYFSASVATGYTRMGTIAVVNEDLAEDFELTVDNAEHVLLATNTADDQYASLGKFALMQVYAKDINVEYVVRPFIEMADGTIVYGDMEVYGMGVYLNNQYAKPTSTEVYKAVLSALIRYGNAMDAYANREV